MNPDFRRVEDRTRQRTPTAYSSDKKTRETRSFSPFDISIAAKVFFNVATEKDRLVEEKQGQKSSFRRVYTWGEYYKSAIVMKEKVHHVTLRKSSPLLIHHDECRHNISLLPTPNTLSPSFSGSFLQPLQNESTYLWQVLGVPEDFKCMLTNKYVSVYRLDDIRKAG